MKLAGAHAVISGGGTGIGSAIAHALASEGARLTLIGRRAGPIEAVARKLGGFAVQADATDREKLDNVLEEARKRHGSVTILINNAGAALTAPFEKTTLTAWHAMFAANLDTVFHLTQAVLPDLRAAPAGRIVAIASTAAQTGYAYASAYSAAKHGVLGFVRSLAVELARTKVTVNAVCPGFTETAIVDDAVANIVAKTGRSADAARADLAAFNPQGRLVTPDQVASATLWLCLPESSAITGQAISVSGGETV